MLQISVYMLVEKNNNEIISISQGVYQGRWIHAVFSCASKRARFVGIASGAPATTASNSTQTTTEGKPSLIALVKSLAETKIPFKVLTTN